MQTRTEDNPLALAGLTSDGVQRYGSTSDAWYNQTTSTEVVTPAYTQYRYRTRTRTYTYTRTVGSDEWSDSYIAGANVRILYKRNGNIDVLRIPAVQVIDEEAFRGSGASVIVVANGTKTIESGAFADCPNLISVMLPDTVTSIAANAFEGCPKLTLFVYPGSYQAYYAQSNGIPYQTITQ